MHREIRVPPQSILGPISGNVVDEQHGGDDVAALLAIVLVVKAVARLAMRLPRLARTVVTPPTGGKSVAVNTEVWKVLGAGCAAEVQSSICCVASSRRALRPGGGATPMGGGGLCGNSGTQIISGDLSEPSNQIRATAVFPAGPRRSSLGSYCTRICPTIESVLVLSYVSRNIFPSPPPGINCATRSRILPILVLYIKFPV